MENKFSLDTSKKKFPMLIMVIGILVAVLQLITRLNLITLVCALYCCIVSAVIFLSLITKKKVYAPMLIGYSASLIGIVLFHIIWGADAGFGAFIKDGTAGWSTAENALMSGEGSFFTRLLGNLLLSLPMIIVLVALSL